MTRPAPQLGTLEHQVHHAITCARLVIATASSAEAGRRYRAALDAVVRLVPTLTRLEVAADLEQTMRGGPAVTSPDHFTAVRLAGRLAAKHRFPRKAQPA